MKKTLFLAAVLVAGAASVSIAQFSSEKRNAASAEQTIEKANNLSGFNFQDTTKPKKDSLPPKQDSTSIKF